MCGHAGSAGDLGYKDLDVFKDLLLWSQVRGEDATGIGAFKRTGSVVDIVKAPVIAAEFLDFKKVNNVINCSQDALIGHTRKSTNHGTNRSREHAHPFHHGHIMGAHNGMLDYSARAKFLHRKTDMIDSEELFYNIAEEGVEDVIPRIYGAWALVWVDTEKKTLNFLRNSQRSLALMFSKDEKRIYWASEWPMLRAALWRHSIETTTEEPVTLSADNWLSFDLTAKAPVKAYTEVPLKGGEEPEKKWQGQGLTHTGGGTTTRTQTRTTPQNSLCVVGGRSGTHGSGHTSTSTKTNSAEVQGLVAKLSRAKVKLVEFDYSRSENWSKNTRDRWKAIFKNIAQLEADLEVAQKKLFTSPTTPAPQEWDELFPGDDSNLPAITILPHLGMTLAAFSKQLNDYGCGVCGQTEISQVVTDNCEMTPTNDIVCDSCAQDDTIRQLSGLQPLDKVTRILS